MSQFHAIAIDGPAASGKSSAAKAVAKEFGFNFINTGAMYRAFTWHVLQSEISPTDTEAVIALLNETKFNCRVRDGASTIGINGKELNEELSAKGVNSGVSPVSAIPEVRDRMVEEQRRYLNVANVIMEGRDIGTHVFPDTPYKFYLDASPEVRIRRRGAQGISDDIRQRDKADSSRKTAPLRPAPDAYKIDTSYLSLEEVVEKISFHLRSRGLKPYCETYVPEKRGFVYFVFHEIARLITAGFYRIDYHNREKASFPGGCFMASNHISFIDPPIIGSALKHEAIHYVARKTLFSNSFSQWLLPRLNAIPLNQIKPDLSTLRTIIKLVQIGKKVVIFPEGERSFDGELLPGQRGVGMLIARSKMPVVPARIFGAHEVYPRGHKPKISGKIDVVFGDPIFFTEEELSGPAKKVYQYVADRVMEEIAKLELPE